MTTKNWFQELHKGHHSFALSIKETLYQKKSDYQEILIFNNELYGNVLVLDGAYMLSDLDEAMYHKAITSYGMQNIDISEKDLNILVIGAGDGGVVRDLFKNWQERIAKITMVEIDGDVIEACKKFFPKIATEFDNPKLDLKVEDALAFIKSADAQSFDLIICDSTDPEGFAAGLIEEDLYRDIKRVLKEEGIFVAQSGSPIFMKEELEKTQENMSKVFAEHHSYLAPMLVYPGVLWSYTVAGKKIIDKTNLDLTNFM